MRADPTLSNQSEWDLFLSHASEDKESLVRPLAQALTRLGVRVWFDEATVMLGDSLVGAIDQGLVNSRYGALVLSPDFLCKPWPDYERRGLTAREVGDDKVVLPLWHGVSRDDVLAFSPPLADKYALRTDGKSIMRIALELTEVIRPDVFDSLSRMAAFNEYVAKLPVETVPIVELKAGPVRHDRLPSQLLIRIRVVQQVFAEVYPVTFAETVGNFGRDRHPDKEVATWEKMSAVFVQIVREDRLNAQGRKELFGLVLTASLRPLDSSDGEGLRYVSVDRVSGLWREISQAVAAFATEGR
jgi:hypothetical protein